MKYIVNMIKQTTGFGFALALLVGLLFESLLVRGQESNGWIDAMIAAGLAIIPESACVLSDRCHCRNIAAVVKSYNPPNSLSGPRMVWLAFREQGGTVCDGGIGNTPIYENPSLGPTTGGILVGNSQTTTFTGVEGNAVWRMWSNDGKYDLDCDLGVYINNPFAGQNSVSPSMAGPGCSKAPVKGPADFQDNYNINIQAGGLIQKNTEGGAEVFVWYGDKKSGNKARSLMATKEEPEKACKDSDFEGIGTSPYKNTAIRTHSILHADELGRKRILNYSKYNCRPFYLPKIGKSCRREADDEWFEYQYSARARYVCNSTQTIDEEIKFSTYMYSRS